MTDSPTTTPATVYLVGAGPGDPGLITVRAVECLARADLILYDYLCNPALLRHAADSAESIGLGHHSTGRALSQDDIVARMIESARAGRVVVRLKGGDPSVFGRGADEIEPLRAAGVPFEIVPGITSGLAVAAYCEIPITHHDDASAVALIAGQERRAKTESHLDYGALAQFPGTLVFYMGVRRAGQWSQALIEHGKPPETPVAIVRWCTRTRQRMVRCTLGTVVEVIKQQGLRPPSLFVVGKVVDRAPQLSWFAARPLYGTRILVAGAPTTSDKLHEQLCALGAGVLVQPAIRIIDPPDWAPLDAAIDRLGGYDWAVFSSSNGVDYLFRRLFARGGDARQLGGVKLAAVGPATAERLRHYHVQADLVPEQFNAESLARALEGEAAGRRFLLPGADRGRQVLAKSLRAAGAEVDRVVAYGSVDVETPSPEVTAALESGEIGWVIVTSPATARSLAHLYGEALSSAQLASISPLTSAALRDLGYAPAAEASPHTVEGIVDAILSR
ncbi:MAG: uroporphyrinogen-III C-methyltransferase [Candidatus Nealsonbacteria bacterium]|nr:uroporphyrinogen-III C-methyltransferase [Candidatus Nealsonbacteria bacterium]